MKKLSFAALVAVTFSFFAVSCAFAFTYNDSENDRYLADLNTYTLQASRIDVWGKTLGVYPDRHGPEVRIQGRGPLLNYAGVDVYQANFVMVGTPCEVCSVEIRRYHIESGRLDNVIAIYRP